MIMMSAVSRASEPERDLPLLGLIVPSASRANRTVVLKPWRWLRIFASIGSASSLRYSSSPERSTTCLPFAATPAAGSRTSVVGEAAEAKVQDAARRTRGRSRRRKFIKR
jgi:hypothetical protein